jgi:hypothetical protein
MLYTSFVFHHGDRRLNGDQYVASLFYFIFVLIMGAIETVKHHSYFS